MPFFVGDLDGDGRGDLGVGCPKCGTGEPGAAYVMFGQVNPTGAHDVSEADITLVAEFAGDWAGASMVGVGDIDGDALDDIAVGAPQAADSSTGEGLVYLLAGLGDTSGTVDLADAPVVLGGIDEARRAGAFLCSGLDWNGDGADELFVGAHDNAVGPGAVYVLFGAAD